MNPIHKPFLTETSVWYQTSHDNRSFPWNAPLPPFNNLTFIKLGLCLFEHLNDVH